MAGGLAAALAGLAHLDSRSTVNRVAVAILSGPTLSLSTPKASARRVGWRSRNLGPTGKMASGANGRAAPPNWRSKSCPRHPRLWKFTFRASTEWSGALARRARSRRSRSLGLAVEAVILF
jgi:hypothetical protein